MKNMMVTFFPKLYYDLKEKKRPVWGCIGGFFQFFGTPQRLSLPK